MISLGILFGENFCGPCWLRVHPASLRTRLFLLGIGLELVMRTILPQALNKIGDQQHQHHKVTYS